jgi:hypothetical protein
MQAKSVWFLAVLLLTATILFAQQSSKPKISDITIMPSDPIVGSGNCKSSTAGYLEPNPSAREIEEFVSKSLHDGYIVTVYPAAKRGTFVNLSCTNAMFSVAP